VLVEDVADDADAGAVAERILEALAPPVALVSGETFVGASIGVALSRQGSTGEELLRDADVAMYLAKQRGRGRVAVCDAPAHTGAVARLRTENELHRALERGEFRLHYQPIVELRGGGVRGFEALIRWHHPSRGLLGPVEFIATAEEAGLIVPIGRWVMEEACRQMARWQSAGSSTRFVNVNLSAGQLGALELVEQVRTVLASTGIEPDRLGLEITESGLMADTDEALTRLGALDELGVRLSIDDFGTGYSSLAYLKRFPVSSLKIDRTFVDGLGSDPGDTAIVSAVIGLAHSLGMYAVAEGVETVDQLEHLRAMRCDFGQGWLFGRPAAAADLGEDPTAQLRSWQVHGRWLEDPASSLVEGPDVHVTD